MKRTQFEKDVVFVLKTPKDECMSGLCVGFHSLTNLPPTISVHSLMKITGLVSQIERESREHVANEQNA